MLRQYFASAQNLSSCYSPSAYRSIQFISAFRPSTEYFIRNAGTGRDGRSCR